MQPPQVYGWAQCSIVPLPNEASVQQARSKDLYIYIYIIVTIITIIVNVYRNSGTMMIV
jgi:hypothetical protein